jgi:hypothetical protein
MGLYGRMQRVGTGLLEAGVKLMLGQAARWGSRRRASLPVPLARCRPLCSCPSPVARLARLPTTHSHSLADQHKGRPLDKHRHRHRHRKRGDEHGACRGRGKRVGPCRCVCTQLPRRFQVLPCSLPATRLDSGNNPSNQHHGSYADKLPMNISTANASLRPSSQRLAQSHTPCRSLVTSTQVGIHLASGAVNNARCKTCANVSPASTASTLHIYLALLRTSVDMVRYLQLRNASHEARGVPVILASLLPDPP